MVNNIDFTVFVPVRSSLYCLVHLFDRSFVYLFVCSCVCGRVVLSCFGRVVDCSFGLLVVWLFRVVILFAWSFGRFLVCSSIRFVYLLSF